MMQFIVFNYSTDAANEQAFNDLHARIMTLKGYPTADGLTLDWSPPVAHPTLRSIAMPVDESCHPAMTADEIASVVPVETLRSNGWFPSQQATTPWWGFLVWWK